jgi:hypothetical protein
MENGLVGSGAYRGLDLDEASSRCPSQDLPGYFALYLLGILNFLLLMMAYLESRN